jgi:hypothetical protein
MCLKQNNFIGVKLWPGKPDLMQPAKTFPHMESFHQLEGYKLIWRPSSDKGKLWDM